MINPISSNSTAGYETPPARNTASTAQQPAKDQPQDSVHLSSKGPSAGDIDHDGDSH